jgi:hypothetical protein
MSHNNLRLHLIGQEIPYNIVPLSLIDLLLYVMSDELIQIKPSEVTFVEGLRESERGAIFRVMVRGRHCAMKVVSDF